MIDIYTEKAEKYSFDPETERVFKDGYLIPTNEVEPVYSRSSQDSTEAPRFSGLWLKEQGIILSLSGKYSPITDPNTII